MASHQELELEWTMLDENTDNWTLNDLQLAAELGRTLLDRNEELENQVKSQQEIIHDQSQEIEYLNKQLNSTKEDNLNRAKFYEQLELSLFDAERANKVLTQKRGVDKNKISSLSSNIEFLERKCEELTLAVETLRRELNRKHFNADYISFSGSSSEDEAASYLYKRRALSLIDLRDFTPSPDDFESRTSHSSSPDPKHSPNSSNSSSHNGTSYYSEYNGNSLEIRVEELFRNKLEGSKKLETLENEVKILLEENSKLHQEIFKVTQTKDRLISELKVELLDLSSPNRTNSISVFPPTPSNSEDCSPDSILSPPSTGRTICTRCTSEINLLDMITSIEPVNFDETEYSSLEYELARANRSSGSSEDEDSIKLVDKRFLQLPKFIFPNETTKSISYGNGLNVVPEIKNLQFLSEPEVAQTSVGVRNRSKFWWLIYWLILVAVGSAHFLWQISKLIIWFSIATIFPIKSPPLLKPSPVCSRVKLSSNPTSPISLRLS